MSNSRPSSLLSGDQAVGKENLRRNQLREKPVERDESEQPSKKPYKAVSKQAKEDNATWRPRAALRRKKTSSSAFLMRASNSSDLTKTAVAVQLDDNTLPIQEAYSQLVSHIPSHRPAKVTELTDAGSPKVLTTPGNTKLYCDSHLGRLKIFSNRRSESQLRPEATSTTKRCLKFGEKNSFQESDVYQTILKFNDAIKTQSMRVSTKSYAATDTERKKNNYQRKDLSGKPVTQNDLMGGSATDYATAAAFTVNHVKWEWLHLIAHEMGGAKYHNDANIVAGTEHANTEMMLVEAEMRFLSEHYPDGFTLEVKADLIDMTEDDEHLQIATHIHYHIITPDFKIEFVFNAQTTEQPHRVFKEYVSGYIHSFVANKSVAEQTVAAPAVSDYSSVLFYKK